MAQLIKPNPQQHQYVVGIDFGHGETSAAICKLEWNVAAGKIGSDASDIRINERNKNNENVMVSAISILEGSGKALIGADAFSAGQQSSGAVTRVCFKEAPKDINGTDEQLMVHYMKAVYEKIRNMEKDLSETNHLVYIARPSGWQDEEVKERYRQMALSAGIPLAGLTSESRAAIFYAVNKSDIGFTRNVENGAIVFDLGSSTLDFTYLSRGEEPIDYGYRTCGASVIDEVIFKDKLMVNEGVQQLLEHYPQYDAILRFKAREIKEEIYNKKEFLGIDVSFGLRTIMTKECSDFEALKNTMVEVEYEDMNEFHRFIEENAHYITELKQALIDFKENHIPGKAINGVFLTGGASRMSFVAETIRETYQLTDNQVRVDPKNPSLTISRGIAMLGRADCISDVMVGKLQEKIRNADVSGVYDTFVERLSDRIGKDAWQVVCKELLSFRNSATDLSVNDLESKIRSAMRSYADTKLGDVFFEEIGYAVSAQAREITKELEKIVSFYTPGTKLRAAKANSSMSISTTEVEKNLRALTENVTNKIAEQVTSNIGEIIANILWAALGLFLWGVFYIGYKAIQFGWNRLTKTEAERKAEEEKEAEEKKRKAKQEKLSKDTRKECYDKIMKQSSQNQDKIITDIKQSLKADNMLKSSVAPEIKKYATEFVQDNINDVRIPIE